MMMRSRLFALLFGCLILGCAASPTRRRSNSEGQIVKSVSDENEYRAITLSNEIRCVVVSDTSTEIAAVQINLGVGSLAEDTPGLAHLVEHLIFFGSVEYPDGKLYTDHLEENGGRYNGFTGQTYTGYTFYVNNRSWSKAAKMLASMIGKPLFPKDMFESAIEAVDSEYRIRIRSDARSLLTLGFDLANPESRDKGFTVGSRETLNVTDIYEQVVDFHDRYYSANLMTLAIVANDTLDSLEALAEETFGSIPNNNRPTPKFSAVPFPTEDKRYLGKKIYFQKKGTGHEITILFPINIQNYPSLRYIKYLMGHKGVGSIYQYLLARGYITTSWRTSSTGADSQKTALVIQCEVTEKGLADPEFILDALFAYLKAACGEGVNVQLWNSINDIDRLRFRFQDKQYPTSIAYFIIENMAETTDTRKYLGAPSERSLDVKLENQVQSFLQPDNFNLYVGSDSFSDTESKGSGPKLTKNEYYYSTPYLDTNFTEEQLDAWRNVKADPELHLPPPNNLVAKNFDIFEVEEDAGEFPLEIVSRSEDNISVWWFQDQEWKKPKTLVECGIYPSSVTRSAKASALRSMLTRMFSLVKDLILYEAKEVSFYPGVKFGYKWEVYVNGYSDPEKVEAVLLKTMEALSSLNFEMSETDYNATVLKPTENRFDEKDDSEVTIAFRYAERLVQEKFLDPADVKNIVSEITQNDIKEYVDSFLKDISVTCSAMGNLRKDQAIRYSRIIKEKLLEKGSLIVNEDRAALIEDPRMFKLPSGPSHIIRRQSENPNAATSAVVVGFQIGLTESTGDDTGKPPYTVYALTELLALIMGPTCFDYLRTEKKLGYAANCFPVERYGLTLFMLYVQGSREGAGPDVMNMEINNLVKQQLVLYRSLAKTAEGQLKFEAAKTTLKEKIFVNGKHRSLKAKAYSFMNEIFSTNPDFNKTEKKMAAVDAITVEDFVDFYDKFIAGDTRRTFSSQVYGGSHKMPGTIEEGEIRIDDIEAYRERLSELY